MICLAACCTVGSSIAISCFLRNTVSLNIMKLDLQEQVRQIQDRVDMEREDHLSWFAREKTYIDKERYQNQLFREDIMKQKHQWTDAIEAKHSQLNRQNEEKLQQINMMEIAIRQQLSEVRLKEDQLQQREAELRQLKES